MEQGLHILKPLQAVISYYVKIMGVFKTERVIPIDRNDLEETGSFFSLSLDAGMLCMPCFMSGRT